MRGFLTVYINVNSSNINAAVQAEDVRASFLFVGDLNGHHQEWLGYTTTNRQGVAAFDFATVSGCDQLVIGLTHARSGNLTS